MLKQEEVRRRENVGYGHNTQDTFSQNGVCSLPVRLHLKVLVEQLLSSFCGFSASCGSLTCVSAIKCLRSFYHCFSKKFFM